MPIEENKLRAAVVQIGMDVRRRTNGRLMSGIKQMNNAGRPWQILQSHFVFVSAGTVNTFIQAVMKQVVRFGARIATAREGFWGAVTSGEHSSISGASIPVERHPV